MQYLKVFVLTNAAWFLKSAICNSMRSTTFYAPLVISNPGTDLLRSESLESSALT